MYEYLTFRYHLMFIAISHAATQYLIYFILISHLPVTVELVQRSERALDPDLDPDDLDDLDPNPPPPRS